MATQIEAARHLVYHAAWLKDGMKVLKKKYMAKLQIELAMKITTEAIQIHGGFGYIENIMLKDFLETLKF